MERDIAIIKSLMADSSQLESFIENLRICLLTGCTFTESIEIILYCKKKNAEIIPVLNLLTFSGEGFNVNKILE